MKTIEVNLDDHLEKFIQKMIVTGEYSDNSDVVCEALTMLERRMKNEGHITDENGDTHSTPESKKPFDIFTKTIRGFYPNTTDDQLEAA